GVVERPGEREERDVEHDRHEDQECGGEGLVEGHRRSLPIGDLTDASPSRCDADRLASALIALEPRAASDTARIRVVHAPGRGNLIGEHTDYNEGFVLPLASDLGISIALLPTDDQRVTLTLDLTGETDGFDLDRIPPRSGGWIDYVPGTAWPMPA